MDNFLASAFKTFDLKLGGLTVSPNYLTAFFVVLLVFLLVFSVARMHHLFIKWSFRGSIIGVVVGFALALVIEGFFILSGTTILTATLGWKNAPKPIAKVLMESRVKLQDVICEPKDFE
ncbi:MAG: hypothetical protein US36_C0002G0065 [Candidatus Wolfebacteria bacterium GW2011_GWC1_37_10]|uniref:Uncharacterized protein n=1 Tax=Candidatus Wolfebacteria bacterium GW2011_GWC1_37_10 TaxID=1619010 RepID=A0A0G0GB96_9BACT|nr:MAG: hypothetical protein US36_C0002G0065 [Candidatus Wolfebacteria bacterium GW2011_GWC1_37_10]